MPDLHYEHPKLAELYDLDNGWSEDRDFYLSLAGIEPKRVLDLGCGTGLLCNAFAEQGHTVTGADPSAAMLEVGKRRSNGSRIEWVQSSAQIFRSSNSFDRIIMTGHAFQVLLDDKDVLESFATMRRHLADGGLIAFETRNPAIDWESEWNGKQIQRESSHGPVKEVFYVRSNADSRLEFDTKYIFRDQELISSSKLRFWCKAEIERHLKTAGLYAENIYGDWDRKNFNAALSREMIFLVRGQDAEG